MHSNSTQYPARPQFFAQKFIRLMVKSCLAQHIGQDAFVLLATIASVEDSKRYRGAVSFFNEQLMALVGTRRWHTFNATRERAVDAGWLHYEAPQSGMRGKPGLYWVLIPEQAQDLPDSPIDESHPPSTESVDAQQQPSTLSVHDSVDDSVDESVEHSILIPNPIPKDSSCPGKIPDPPKVRFSDEDLELAKWFWNSIHEMNPAHKPPKLDQWANTVRLMRERDHRTHADIRQLITRIQQDEFWRVNVLSPEKLRQKFDELQIRLSKGSTNGKHRIDRTGPGQRFDPGARVGEGF